VKRAAAYLELTKPRITCFILMSTAIGFLFGLPPGATSVWMLLAHTLIGTALIASGTAALNQWYERAADAQMNRTRNRPIPSGRVGSRSAAAFGVALSILGFADLALGTNPLAALLGLFTLVTYLFVYTPLKQRSPHATTIGAIPGAMPPLIGFAAACGTLTSGAWILYAILFLWQFPHFYAIAWIYREDYARAGIRMLPVVEPDGVSTARRIVVLSAALIPLSIVPSLLGMAGTWYLVGSIVLGLAMLAAGWRASQHLSRLAARHVLLASVIYLPLLYGFLVFDRPGL
jgi:protoheme IX farnesyltransferase